MEQLEQWKKRGSLLIRLILLAITGIFTAFPFFWIMHDVSVADMFYRSGLCLVSSAGHRECDDEQVFLRTVVYLHFFLIYIIGKRIASFF